MTHRADRGRDADRPLRTAALRGPAADVLRAARRLRRRSPQTPQQRARRAARARANRKVGVAVHAVAWLATLLLILVATRSPRVVLLVASAWGIGLALHYFVALVVPGWRQRWIDDAVGRSAPEAVDEERRSTASRKVRSLEELSASIAHEIRNPIAAAKSLVQQMGEDPTADGNVEYAQVALAELDRVERSISHLLRYARDEELRLETVDVAGLVTSALDAFRDRIARAGVRLDCDLEAAGFVRGDAEKLRRVLINLIGNALDAMDGAGATAPLLRVSAGENLAGSEAWVRVRDAGPGLDAATRERIFDPFFTTREAGTGLGLALSRKLVEAHGGVLEVESEPGAGAEFIVMLPREPAAPGASAARDADRGSRR